MTTVTLFLPLRGLQTCGNRTIRFIQQILGHVKLETTQIYTQVSIRQVKDIHTATHPAKDEAHVAEELWAELEKEFEEEAEDFKKDEPQKSEIQRDAGPIKDESPKPENPQS